MRIKGKKFLEKSSFIGTVAKKNCEKNINTNKIKIKTLHLNFRNFECNLHFTVKLGKTCINKSFKIQQIEYIIIFC